MKAIDAAIEQWRTAKATHIAPGAGTGHVPPGTPTRGTRSLDKENTPPRPTAPPSTPTTRSPARAPLAVAGAVALVKIVPA